MAAAARALLTRVASQDVEEDGDGGVQIKHGVEKDRVISTVDPQARHGHKSSAGRWNGYKKHVSVEPSRELITAVAVTPANAPDGPVALTMLEQQAACGLAPAEVVVDMAYRGAELRAAAQGLGDGTTLITRDPAQPHSEVFPKSVFEVDCAAGIVTCPANQPARFTFRSGHSATAHFAAETCASCPWKPCCVLDPLSGRSITIHPFEDQLQAARDRREKEDFPALMRERPKVERKQAHWNRKGGHRSRYMGMTKTRLQALWSAAVVNIERLMVVGPEVLAPARAAGATG